MLISTTTNVIGQREYYLAVIVGLQKLLEPCNLNGCAEIVRMLSILSAYLLMFCQHDLDSNTGVGSLEHRSKHANLMYYLFSIFFHIICSHAHHPELKIFDN